MSQREDKKLQEVLVAEYRYRHEAEFAAGFLDDAGIPYRLQIDDPALGLTVGVPAMIWVRGMDVVRARDILDVGNELVAPGERAPVRRQRVDGGLVATRLVTRERLMSVVGASGFVWLAWYLEAAGSDNYARLAGVGAIVLVAAAVAGRAPRVLKRLLSAISGSEP